MGPQLMGSAGVWPQLEPGMTVRGAANTVVGDCPLAGGIDDHAPAAASTELSKPGLDSSLGIGRPPLYDGPIDFLHLPTGEQRAQPPQRLRVPRNSRQPAVSRSRRWVSAGACGRPKRSSSKPLSRLGPPPGPGWTATPAGLSMTRIRPSR